MPKTKGAISDKPSKDALRLAVNRKQWDENRNEERKRLNIIADKICEEAIKGEGWAIKEIFDRLDGKPRQQIDHAGEDGRPITHKVLIETIKAQSDAS